MVVIVLCSHFTGVKVSGAGMGNSLAGLTYYATNEDDPYITLKENDVGSCFSASTHVQLLYE